MHTWAETISSFQFPMCAPLSASAYTLVRQCVPSVHTRVYVSAFPLCMLCVYVHAPQCIPSVYARCVCVCTSVRSLYARCVCTTVRSLCASQCAYLSAFPLDLWVTCGCLSTFPLYVPCVCIPYICVCHVCTLVCSLCVSVCTSEAHAVCSLCVSVCTSEAYAVCSPCVCCVCTCVPQHVPSMHASSYLSAFPSCVLYVCTSVSLCAPSVHVCQPVDLCVSGFTTLMQYPFQFPSVCVCTLVCSCVHTLASAYA